MNTANVASGIASTLGALSAPSGYTSIRLATHRLPNAIVEYPTLLVMPPTREINAYGGAAWGPLVFPVQLFVAAPAPEDLAADALYAWWDVVQFGLVNSYDLNLSNADVIDAQVTGLRGGTLVYAEQQHIGLLIEVTVNASSAYNATT